MAGGLVRTALQGVASSGANIGDVINVGFAYSDYKNAKQQGNSTAVSVAKAAGTFAWGEFFYGGVGRAIGSTKLVSGLAAKGGKAAIGAGALTMGGTIALTALMAGGQVASAIGQHTGKEMAKAYSGRGKFGSGYFEMSQAGYTMRQRSLNAIRSNGLNTQSVLGNEARTYYRSAI